MRVQLQNEGYFLCYDASECRLFLGNSRDQLLYETKKMPGETQGLSLSGRTLEFDYLSANQRIHVMVTAEKNGQFVMEFTGEGQMAECAFPGPWLQKPEDLLLYPLGDGIAWPARQTPVFPQRLNFSNGSQLSMGMVGFLRGQGGLLMGIEETADAALEWQTGEGGLIENQVIFLPAKGEWRYGRRLRLFIAETDGLNSLCAAYRAWRMELGFVVPLTEKAKRAPRILGMAGRADMWLFDDQNMNRLYGRPVGPEETKRDVRRAADEMIALGMDRVLFNSFEGESREDAAYLKAKGFEVGRYDIYRDVIPKPNVPFMLPYRVKRSRHTETCWPQDVRREADGTYAVAWKLHGTDGNMYDQHGICDMPALRMTMTDVPPLIEEIGYTSWFIDVGTGAQLRECYHPAHPADRRDAMRYLKAQNQFLLDMGLIGGVEVGCEAGAGSYVFSEGMMSPPCFRAPDSGRRMNTLYYGEEIPEKITNGMLNPRLRLPLWQLIYHDCTINYWYWGDSSNCCPELMPLRDQLNALYAVPPLYSVNMTQWEQLKNEIAASYHRAVPAARAAAFSPMTRFDYLTEDHLVQQTTFANGVRVTANFSDAAFEDILPHGCRILDGDGQMIAAF